MGVAIALLTTMAQVKASDRAKIEMCFLRDIIRIVSRAFVHHHALGDIKIYDELDVYAIYPGDFSCLTVRLLPKSWLIFSR